MQIIIIGCGKVGKYLVRELSEENHNITIIDIRPEAVRETTAQYDIMGIEGNGTSYTTLQEADIAHADILIAVTESDEVNLLCCFIAKKANCRTIARVRNPIYLAESEIFRQELGISMIINPELAGAREIMRLLQFPSAVEISSFAKGRIDMLSFRVRENSILIGKKLRNIPELAKYQILICVAERGSQIVIPNGDFVVEKGDLLSFVAIPGQAAGIFREMGIYSHTARDVMIIGGGQTAFYLARMLLETGIHVKLIEKNRKRAEELSMLLPKADVICGDGSNQGLLAEEHIEQMDACVAATNIDEENIILSLYARDMVRKKVVTKISRLEFNEVIQSLNLDSVVNPKETTAESILMYVRAMSNVSGSNIQTLYKLSDDRVEALEFIVRANSPLLDTELKDMKLKKDVLIAGIVRHGRLIIPGGTDQFMTGDSVVIATTHRGFQQLEDILERQASPR